jgi:hypothetical protein
MQKIWEVEVLVFKDDEHDDRDTILVLIDDKEWLRAHFDAATEKWVESKTAHLTYRHEQRTAHELLFWLLSSSASSRLVEPISWAVRDHLETIGDREKARAQRDKLETIREKASKT